LTHERFETEAAAYIDTLKLKHRYKPFGETLPLPTHVRTAEISGMKLSPRGRLSFCAQSDTHDFKVSLSKLNQLRNALMEAGFGRV
jgi:hypothetical protein